MAKKTTRKKTTSRAKAKPRTAARKPAARKAPARKTAARKPAAAAAAKPARLTTAERPRTKSEIYTILAENAGVSKKQVSQIFDTLGEVLKKDLSKRGPGALNLAGMMKITVQRKPATKARKGINPFTKEPTTFKAKPARNVVKVRPMKALKDLV
jgi:nucleoid DNA-binding protein